ncbi:MAG: phosphate-starvation-inducible PsiE family protein [Ferrimicrobium sp.]
MKRNNPASRAVSNAISVVETIIYFAIAIVIAAMALETLYQALQGTIQVNLALNVTAELVSVLNEVLFVIILLELLGTVLEHLKRGGFQLRPFLIIGIVSSVRRILVIGAQLSTLSGHSNNVFHRELLELGVDSGVAFVLTLALYVAERRRSRIKKIDVTSSE